MTQPNNIAVNMESEALANLKNDMNRLITHTLMSMQAWDKQESAITVKLTINLEELMRDDGKGGMRAVTVPHFEHKISAVLQAKAELKGKARGDYELVYDEFTNSYSMKSLDSNQTTLFDEPVPFADDEDLMLEDDEDLTIDDDDLLLIDDQDDEELEIDYEQAQAQ